MPAPENPNADQDPFKDAPLFKYAAEQQQARLNEAVDSRALETACRGVKADTSLQIRFTGEYAEIVAHLREQRDRAASRVDNVKSTYEQERREWVKLEQFAVRNGPERMVLHALKQIREGQKKGFSDKKYAERIYSEYGSRSIFPLLNKMIAPLRLQDTPVDTIVSGIKTGKIKLAANPKDQVLEHLLKESKHLAADGRVLIIVDDNELKNSDNAARLAKKIASFDLSREMNIGVGFGTKTSPDGRAFRTLEGNNDGRLDVQCITSKQLRDFRQKQSGSLHAALVIGYSLKVRQADSKASGAESGTLDLPPARDLPIIYTDQVIELTHVDRPFSLGKRLEVRELHPEYDEEDLAMLRMFGKDKKD